MAKQTVKHTTALTMIDERRPTLVATVVTPPAQIRLAANAFFAVRAVNQAAIGAFFRHQECRRMQKPAKV